jgi:uncharacterized protein (DUF1330 family)
MERGEQSMAKGYWIVHVDVSDAEAYKRYVAANAAPLAMYGGRFIVRGGPYDCVEGKTRTRNVVIEFSSLEAATACYQSPEYQAAKALRLQAAEADFVIIGGYDGPQPGEAA